MLHALLGVFNGLNFYCEGGNEGVEVVKGGEGGILWLWDGHGRGGLVYGGLSGHGVLGCKLRKVAKVRKKKKKKM